MSSVGKSQQVYLSGETVEDKIRKYTRPHPLVTSHLRNYRANAAAQKLLNNGRASSPRSISPDIFNAAAYLHYSSSRGVPHGRGGVLHQSSMLDVCYKNVVAASLPPLAPSVRNGSRKQHHQKPVMCQVSRKRAHSHANERNHDNKYGKRAHYGKRSHSSSSAATSPVDPSLLDKSCEDVFAEVMAADEYLAFTEEIEAYSRDHAQSQALLEKKLKLRSALLLLIRRQFPGISLHLVGSSCNGFASDSSDADFCIMFSFARDIDQMFEAPCYLKDIEHLFRSMRTIKNIQFIQAKVPILKFQDTVSGCICDININNSVGIRNTRLLRAYSKADARVRLLVLVVKRWAKSRGINDASHGTLSSYSLVLMTLHYLQYGCRPPVLQSLQKHYPSCFQLSLEIEDQDSTEKIPCNDSENTESVGRLFEGFFRYFSTVYRWDDEVISVRLGTTLLKKDHAEFIGRYIGIEEPFNLSNTARAVHELPQFEAIKEEFSRANDMLKERRSLQHIL